MGMARPTGRYVEHMLGPAGWPDIDEDALYDRAREYMRVLRQVTDVLETCQHQQAEIFDSGVWSGGTAAAAANGKLATHIDELLTLQNGIATVITWQRHVASSIIQAKSDVGDNLESARRQIKALFNDPSLSKPDRSAAIRRIVDATLIANDGVIVDSAEQILDSKTWAPPRNAVENLLDQRVPPPGTVHDDSPADPEVDSGSVSGAAGPDDDVDAVMSSLDPDLPLMKLPGDSGLLAALAGSPASPGSVAVPGAAARQSWSGALSGSPHTRMAEAAANRQTPVSRTGPAQDPRPSDEQPPADSDAAMADPAADGAAAANPTPTAPLGHGMSPQSTSGNAGAPSNPATPLAEGQPHAASSPGGPSSGASAAQIPVSAARAERDATAEAATADAARRDGPDPLQLARRIAAALNAPGGGGQGDMGFFWLTAVTTDGTIVVANSYGLAYIPEGVQLPEQVTMASADEAIPAAERARWVTYPVLAVQGWVAHHEKKLRAVIGTAEQLAGSDPGAAQVVLEPDDIPARADMSGRSRLEVADPHAAKRLAATPDAGLASLLPPAPSIAGPADSRHMLWFDVMRTLPIVADSRQALHLKAFQTYAAAAEEGCLTEARAAAGPDTVRTAIAEWLYWKHLAGLLDSITAPVSSGSV